MKRSLHILVSILAMMHANAQSSDAYTEVKLFNSLYSQTSNFDNDGSKIADTARRSFVTNILELNFHRPNKRLWWGFDAYFRASRQGPTSDSPLKALKYESNGFNAQSALSHLGPKFNWKINKDNDNLYLRLLMLIPLGGSNSIGSATLPTLDNSGVQLWSQINYNAKLAEKLYGYGELTIINRFGRASEPKNDLFIPIKVFLSFFPAEAIGIFGFVDFTPTLSSPTAHYFQSGGGIKLFPSKDWQIELSASSFLAGRNSGAGYAFNLGLSHNVRPKQAQR